jgi:hypothetical protein
MLLSKLIVSGLSSKIDPPPRYVSFTRLWVWCLFTIDTLLLSLEGTLLEMAPPGTTHHRGAWRSRIFQSRFVEA